LALAVGFAALLNSVLLTTFVWTEWVGSTGKLASWVLVGTVWLAALVVSRRSIARQHAERQRVGEPESSAAEDLFPKAVNEYLQGNWFKTEAICQTLIQNNPRDLDAQLMLATLLRRCRRFDEAARRLDQVQRLEGAEGWEREIAQERARLAEAKKGEQADAGRGSPSQSQIVGAA
jgi:hypothetical protein